MCHRHHPSALIAGAAINPYEVPARLLLDLSLMLLVGMPVSAHYVALPVLSGQAGAFAGLMTRLRRVMSGALLGVAAGALLLFGAQLIPLDLDFSPDQWRVLILQTRSGQTMLTCSGLALIGLLALRALRSTQWWPWVCVLTGVLCQAAMSRASHSAAMSGSPGSIAADLAHLIGGGLWAGGLIVLALTMSALMRSVSDAQQPALTARLIRRFALTGIAGVALVTGAGLLLAPLHIAQFETLFETPYGLLLTGKIVATALAVLLAGLHKFASLRSMRTVRDARRFAMTLRVEIFLVLFAFIGAALLTASAPPGHQMSGALSHQMPDTPFQTLLRTSAYGIGLAGFVASVREWRGRKKLL